MISREIVDIFKSRYHEKYQLDQYEIWMTSLGS